MGFETPFEVVETPTNDGGKIYDLVDYRGQVVLTHEDKETLEMLANAMTFWVDNKR